MSDRHDAIEPPSRGKGRPVVFTADEQRDRVLDAFHTLLSDEAFEVHSMAQIAKIAGVSKRTVYDVAESKEALVKLLLERFRSSVIAILDTEVTSPSAAAKLLHRFMVAWTQAALAPVAINIARMAMDERRTFPGIGESYLITGANFMTERLTQWLKAQIAAGNLRATQPELLADVLSSAIISRNLFSMAFGLRAAPTPSEIDRHVKFVLKICEV